MLVCKSGSRKAKIRLKHRKHCWFLTKRASIYDAAFLFFVIAFAGIGVCLYFRRDRYIWGLEEER